jgi:branched-chain amino acid transport system ATP-binding protein
MLATARALMARPKLLMLDEPSLGLAPKIVETILSIIQDINQTGVAVLLVEQNAQLALKAASRAYLLDNGTIAKTGATSEFLADETVRRSYLGI